MLLKKHRIKFDERYLWVDSSRPFGIRPIGDRLPAFSMIPHGINSLQRTSLRLEQLRRHSAGDILFHLRDRGVLR